MNRNPKTPEEIEHIKSTQRAVEAAFDAVTAYLLSIDEPTSERSHEIIDEVLREYGCESPEGHIVAGGMQGAEPHEYGSGVILPHTPIVIDIYPRSTKTGYYADMTRTVCIGEPSSELQNMYDTVLKAQEVGISLIKPGARCSDIQAAVETVFVEAGYKTYGKGKEFAFKEGFVHGVGHGVGLEVHEAPRIGSGSDDVLQAGDVVTVEPGLYYFDKGGIRLEDLLLVTADGSENLTKAKKEFILSKQWYTFHHE